jgi:hypothetical protein
MSLSFAIFSPFSLSASDLALIDNIKQLQDFIVSAKSDADKLKGLKIANDNDIAEVSANIIKFLDFPLIVSSAISLPLKPFLNVSLASLSASNKVSKCSKLKGLKIANDNDIAEVSANIKELNADQETLTKARDILMV